MGGGDRLRCKALKVATGGKDGASKSKGGGMPAAARKLLCVAPKVVAPLDKGFRPLILGKKNYLEATKDCTEKLEWALIRGDGCARASLPVFDEKHKDVRASSYLAGVLIQEMIWQRGASELRLSGPKKICEALKKAYSVGG